MLRHFLGIFNDQFLEIIIGGTVLVTWQLVDLLLR